MTTGSSERRIERAVLDTLTGKSVVASSSRVKATGAGGWIVSTGETYDRSLAIDVAQLAAFLNNSQTADNSEAEPRDMSAGSPWLSSFLAMLDTEIAGRGVIDVLRRGVESDGKRQPVFFGMQSRFTQNRFSVIPRLRYSHEDPDLGVDLCLLINGLPIATLELTDGPPKRSIEDAIERYMRVHDPRAPLFRPGRCMAHFAVSEQEAFVCSELRGGQSIFSTFNQGSSDSAGNPTNLFGLATDYLWRQILTRPGVIDIVENYAHIGGTDDSSNEGRTVPIFPRYHQLEVVRRLLAHAEQHGAGHRYLVEHSVGSGSSQTIAWLTDQLVYLQQDSVRIFDAIFVVSDRREVARRLSETIRDFPRLSAAIEPERDARGQIGQSVQGGVSVIVASIDHLPIILQEIDERQRGRRFAVIVDEAARRSEPEGSAEEKVNRLMTGRQAMSNTSLFVFAPGASDAARELFGQPFDERGIVKFRPFHAYSA